MAVRADANLRFVGVRPGSIGMFTPEERQQILDRLLAELETDARIAGVLVVGSGAVGFEDACSDIDLAVVTTRAGDVRPTFADWRGRIEGMFSVRRCAEVQRAANVFLYAMLLDSFLELDISFQSLDDLAARRARWKVAFDRTGRIEGLALYPAGGSVGAARAVVARRLRPGTGPGAHGGTGRAAAACFFNEARACDARLGLDEAPALEALLFAFLEEMG